MRFDSQTSRYGAVVKALPFTTGKTFFVKNASDMDYADFTYEFPLDAEGVPRVYSTFAAAAAATVANRYDVIVVPDQTFQTPTNYAAVAATTRVVTLADVGAISDVTIIKKTIVSSAITTSAQDLSLVANGDMYIENIVLKTDGATGLAGATNFRILSNNAKGALPILEETVANLGAAKTVDLFGATIVKQRTVLESGKKLQFLGTVGAGTGAGTVDVYVYLKKVTPTSYVQNA